MKGFILITVLVVLLSLSFICLHAYKLQVAQTQSLFHHWIYRLAQAEANEILNGLEKKLSTLSNCFIPIIANKQLLQQPKKFWQNRLCGGKSKWISYYFVLEKLHDDACQVMQFEHSMQKAKFYRLSLLAEINGLPAASFLLQRVSALPSVEKIVCGGEYLLVKRGLRMQRQLIREND